ncbi:uncharacterized protein B0H18DRAFT_1169560 [Fomitopsis serialis]|uniref:uncharacterized protein n=1 Tax=Fomitopsis serialis TaxID=139415 RepID=UPI00200829FA|nr:uncharacterized protein B0H18DRAFT_1169560 [Neoantrodia serialis]KAH9925834.1 hypothetical protein B0H18DRAFT_1169560 [Neoantrodia serialis]
MAEQTPPMRVSTSAAHRTTVVDLFYSQSLGPAGRSTYPQLRGRPAKRRRLNVVGDAGAGPSNSAASAASTPGPSAAVPEEEIQRNMVLVGPMAKTFTCNIGVCRAQVAPTNEALREHLEAVHPDPCGNILDRSGPGFCPWNGCGGIQIRSTKERNKSGARTMKLRHILGLHGALRADYRCLVCSEESRLETKRGMEKHVRACLKKSRRAARKTTAAATPVELLETDDINTFGLTAGTSTNDGGSPVSPQGVAMIRSQRKSARSYTSTSTAASVNGCLAYFVGFSPAGARKEYTPFEDDAATEDSEDPPAAWQPAVYKDLDLRRHRLLTRSPLRRRTSMLPS